MEAMRISEALARLRITDVWSALGGGPLRSNRGKAFWRDGDGYTVSLNDSKGAWYDFRDAIGGGIVDLAANALPSDRPAAIEWIANAFNLDIDRKPFSQQERSRYARARGEAELFLEWRRLCIAELRDRRNDYLDLYHRALKLILEHSLDHAMGSTWADACEAYEARYQAQDKRIDSFIATPFQSQIAAYRESVGRPA